MIHCAIYGVDYEHLVIIGVQWSISGFNVGTISSLGNHLGSLRMVLEFYWGTMGFIVVKKKRAAFYFIRIVFNKP